MAPDRKSDEILLNALVDGELSPADQAAAAARLVSDREFARAYATLSKLKASVADTTGEGLSKPISIAVPPARRNWLPYAAAASMAAVAILGSAALLLQQKVPPAVQETSIPAAPVMPAAFAADPVIPDLSTAGLQLARTVVNSDAGAQALVATYVGPRGCRLELWVGNVKAPAGGAGATARRAWRVGGLAYELVAYGMPSERFEKVAAAAEEATRATTLPEEPDQRLIQARVASAPCLS